MKKLIVVAVVFAAGCTDAQMGKIGALGEAGEVVQYSGGKEVGRWCSTGKISNSENSDGFYFRDAKSRQFLEISGDVRITYGACK